MGNGKNPSTNRSDGEKNPEVPYRDKAEPSSNKAKESQSKENGPKQKSKGRAARQVTKENTPQARGRLKPVRKEVS